MDVLQVRLLCASGPTDGKENGATAATSDQLELIIKETRNIPSAFQPFRDQPLQRVSLLLPGATGLSPGDYLTLFG